VTAPLGSPREPTVVPEIPGSLAAGLENARLRRDLKVSEQSGPEGIVYVVTAPPGQCYFRLRALDDRPLGAVLGRSLVRTLTIEFWSWW